MLYFLEAAADSANPAGGGLTTILMLVIMVAIFYFMLIRPENKRKKEAEAMRSSMRVGDEVVTIGGITGKVIHIKDEKFVIETGADQVRMEFQKWALSVNETGNQRAKDEAKKAADAKAKAKAAKKAEKLDR